MKNFTLGEKIRKFRTRAGLSQLDLECKIGAASGSVSRIESGRVNPTKETLLKIVKVLDLQTVQIASLFEIQLNDLIGLVQTGSKLGGSLNLDEVLQNAVNEITYELDLLGACICLREEDRICAKTMTQTWYTEAFRRFLPRSFDAYSLSLSEHKDNLLVRTINDKKSFFTSNFYEASKYAYSEIVTSMIVKVMGFKCGRTFPIIHENEAIGAFFFVKNYVDDFTIEKSIIKAFSDHVATAISNAKKYEELKKKLGETNIQNLRMAI